MRRVSVIVVATASTLFLSAAGWRMERPSNPRDLHVRAEIARLRAHFDSVDTELRTRDVSHLSATQRASRTKLIGWLREYRDAGQFPGNDRFANEAVPFFRDSGGTLCAMAYLVDRSGRGDIVEHIAKTRNNAFIGELTDDRELVVWLEASGLTVSEAARIQPAYNGDPCCTIVPDRVSRDHALLSVGLGGTSLGTLGFNLFSPSRISGAAGVMAGVATIIVGAVHVDEGTGNAKLGIANIAVGSGALIAGVSRLLAKGYTRERAPSEASKRELLTQATIAPDLIVSPGETRVGLRLHARF